MRTNFDRFIRRPEHTNRVRLSTEKRCPTLKSSCRRTFSNSRKSSCYYIIYEQQQLKLHPATGSTQAHCNCKTACNTKRCGCVKTNRTCTIHCHPRGIGNGICCNKPSRVGEDEYEEVNAIDQAGEREADDSEDREADDSEVE